MTPAGYPGEQILGCCSRHRQAQEITLTLLGAGAEQFALLLAILDFSAAIVRPRPWPDPTSAFTSKAFSPSQRIASMMLRSISILSSNKKCAMV
jgi:hypothetical protein